MNNKTKKKAYQLFAIASIVYLVGVVGFTVWVYFTHRNQLFKQLDQSLVQSVYAAEQIIGEPILSQEQTVKSSPPQLVKALSNQLTQFASATYFDAIVAAVIQQQNVYTFVSGTRSVDPLLKQSILQNNAMEAVLKQIDYQADVPWSGYVKLASYGTIRVAVLYRETAPLSGYALVAIDSVSDVRRMLRIELAEAFAKGLFLIIMVYPMVLFYNRAQQVATKKLEILNAQLQQDVLQQRTREAKLEDAIHDLERLNAVTVGRESRLTDLKQEVNGLLNELGRPSRYQSSFDVSDET